MDFDAILDRAIAAIDAAKPKVQATERQILTFVLDDYIAGFSTRRNGITYVLVTSWFNGQDWEGAESNVDWPRFFHDWIGIPFMSRDVKFRVGCHCRHMVEIRAVFPESVVPFSAVFHGGMVWIDPSAPGGGDNALEYFAPNPIPYSFMMRNQTDGTLKTLSVAPFSSVKEVEPAED